MIHKIYCIYDNKIASFGIPFFAPLREVAYRHMRRAVANPQLDVAQFPSDFALFEMGEYDDLTGSFQMDVSPQNLGPLTQFKESTT